MKRSELGSKILTLRNQKGITQKELADLCHVDIRTIQRIEANEVVPRMHTIKLLSKSLDFDLTNFNGGAENESKDLSKEIRLAFIAGIVFSLNYILIIFNIATKSFNLFAHVITTGIHIVTFILFLKGFYLLGRQFKNQLLANSALIAIILLPILNITDLLQEFYFMGFSVFMLFMLVCVNSIISGVSYLMEAPNRKNPHKIMLYKSAGVIMIIQSVLFMTLNFNIIIVGLIISAGCNLVCLTILYLEHQDMGKLYMREPDHIFA